MTRTTEAEPAAPTPGRLHAHVRESLLADIRAGIYAQGGKLPSEHALCEAFGVSRITVRQALADLERQEVIDRIHGRGTFVRRAKAFQQATELQGFSEAMAPLGLEVRNRLQGFHYLRGDADTVRMLGLEPDAEVASIERVRLLDGQPVSFERTLVAGDVGRLLALADLVTRDLFAILEQDLHRPLGHAQLAIEAAAADPAFEAILGVPLHTPLLKVVRQVFDADGRPLAYEHLYFRTDAFQYRMRVDRVGRPPC
ncbi:MAG: GntR family transcriptional regulator [Xenophilus sp.]